VTLSRIDRRLALARALPVVGALLLAPSRAAHAAVPDASLPPPPAPSAPRWHFALGVETDVPVDLAVRAEAETPFRLRLSTSVGFLPGAYVQALNGVLEGAGAYDAATGTLISSTLQSSLVWRTHLGVRPFSKLGLYGDVGYGLVALGGSASTSDVLSAVTGKQFPQTEGTSARAFGINATLHMLDVEIGWTFDVADHVLLRVAIGGAFTLAAPTTVTPQFTPRAPAAVGQFTSEAATYLSNEMTSYVFTPVLTVGGAYGF
jgi:hypothetical protein